MGRRAPAVEKLARDEAVVRLAQRYVAGHGPAQARDLAWWSGLTLADARRALAASSNLERAVIDGNTYFFTPVKPLAKTPAPVVHLLPNYDELLIAFKDRSHAFDSRVTPDVSALAVHFLVIDGRIAGGYRRTLGRDTVTISVQLLRSLSTAERKALAAAASRFGKSLGLSAKLEL